MDRFACDLLLTMAPDSVPITDAVVDVDDGAVIWSGPSGEAPDRPDAVVRHISGALLPGFVDTHAHSPMVLLRGAGDGLPVDRWLDEVMWPREARLVPDDVSIGMLAGGAELLAGGITTSVEMYFHGEAIARAIDKLGMRCLITPPVIEGEHLTGFGPWEAQLDEMMATRERWSANPRVDVGLGPHAAYSVSEPCLRRIAQVAASTDMLVHIHLAEQRWEDDEIRSRSGLSAPAYLESLGVLDGPVVAAHGIWLDDDDLEVLARHDVAISHCPCSNAKHASGVARIDEMRSAGIRVALGTDGPASHHRLDPFDEMRTAIRLARLRLDDAEHFTPLEALTMFTADAADAIGRPDLGRLTVGSRADMIALSLDGPAMHPIAADDDPVSRLVWSGSPSAVTDVWVEGRHVVESGRVVSIDSSTVLTELDEHARRIAR